MYWGGGGAQLKASLAVEPGSLDKGITFTNSLEVSASAAHGVGGEVSLGVSIGGNIGGDKSDCPCPPCPGSKKSRFSPDASVGAVIGEGAAVFAGGKTCITIVRRK